MTEVFATIGFAFVLYTVIVMFRNKRNVSYTSQTTFNQTTNYPVTNSNVRTDGVYSGLVKDEKNNDVIIGMMLLVFKEDSMLRLPLPLNEIEFYRNNENLKKFFYTVNTDRNLTKHFNGRYLIKGNQITIGFTNQIESLFGGGIINGDSIYLYFGTQKNTWDSKQHSGCINFQFFQCV